MSYVYRDDHDKEIQKHKKLLEFAIDKLKKMKKDYLVSQTELSVAEEYITKLQNQIKELKKTPVHVERISSSSKEYLERLQNALELDDIDVDKITSNYINRKKYNL